jgi:3-dehydroquinate synthase
MPATFTPRRVAIDFGARSYEILIGRKLLDDPASYLGVPASPSAAIVTNSTVAPLYAERLAHALAAQHRDIRVIELDDGEEFKDWRSLDRIYEALLVARADRRTVLYALGGGVVGDMAGFAAATYMRGVPFVQVPTTLLAQVDSSVGGKTAINHARGKNMVGAFHQPVRVIADLDTLDTLPQREVAAGLAEVIKYGPVADEAFLGWIERNVGALVARDKEALAHAVARSCQIKADVVAQDEREEGLRAILNFGHTFGHAIEAALGYGRWLHGEAVGCGMVMAADLSARLGLVASAYAERLTRLIAEAGLPIHAPAVDPDALIELMRIDKKSQAGEIRFVVIEGEGRASVRPAPDALVREVIGAHSA